jgi:hypothetical protein
MRTLGKFLCAVVAVASFSSASFAREFAFQVSCTVICNDGRNFALWGGGVSADAALAQLDQNKFMQCMDHGGIQATTNVVWF